SRSAVAAWLPSIVGFTAVRVLAMGALLFEGRYTEVVYNGVLCRIADYLRHRTGLRPPDVRSVFRDGAVARKRAGVAAIQDGFAGPLLGVSIQFSNLLLRMSVCRQICQVHVMIAVREERIPDRRKHPMLGMAKGIVADHIQGITDLWLMLVVPMRVIPATAG